MPTKNSDLVSKLGTIVGWGRIQAGTLPSTLQQASMIVPTTLQCLDSHRDFFGYFLNDANFCAGYRNGTTACAGDSGGGLYFFDKTDDKWILRGIVSIGVRENSENGCNFDHFVLFTDVFAHLDWIYRTVGRFR